jgi:starvation-inducible outer membrane lipoprotein
MQEKKENSRGRRSDSCIDDPNECQAYSRDNQQGADIIETFDCLTPGNSTRVLGRVIKPKDANERKKLEDKTLPVHILLIPFAAVDSVSTHDGTNDNDYVY